MLTRRNEKWEVKKNGTPLRNSRKWATAPAQLSVSISLWETLERGIRAAVSGS